MAAPQTPSSLYSSPIITLVAGQGSGAEFLAHSGLLARESGVFSAMLSGPRWKESIESRIELKSWDEETVGRVIEWLYSQDCVLPYATKPPPTTPQGKAIEADPKTPQQQIRKRSYDEVDEDSDAPVAIPRPTRQAPKGLQRNLSLGALAKKATENVQHRTTPTAEFQKWLKTFRDSSGSSSSSSYYGYSSRASRPFVELDFSEAFLSCARLYCFGIEYIIKSLQVFALSRLFSMLQRLHYLSAGAKAIDGFVDLARYVFHNVPKREKKDEGEPMRDMVSSFMCLEMGAIKGNESAQELMEEGGDFSVEVTMRLASQQWNSQDVDTLRNESQCTVLKM